MTTDPKHATTRTHELRLYLVSALALTYVVAWWTLGPTEAPDPPSPALTTTTPRAVAPFVAYYDDLPPSQRPPLPPTWRPAAPAISPKAPPSVRRVATPSRRVRTRSS